MVVEYLFLFWNRLAENKRLSKSLLRFSLKRRNQTSIIAEKTADTWRQISLKKK